MADIRGIELTSETYYLEDTSARNTASNANAKATKNETAISELQSDVETLTDDALTPKTLENMQITLAEGYSASSAIIQYMKQVGRVITGNISIENITGPNIGTISTANIGTCQLSPVGESFAIGLDFLSATVIRVGLSSNGVISIRESENMPTERNRLEIPFTIIV